MSGKLEFNTDGDGGFFPKLAKAFCEGARGKADAETDPDGRRRLAAAQGYAVRDYCEACVLDAPTEPPFVVVININDLTVDASVGGGLPPYVVDWGDGSETASSDLNLSHTYADEGTYTATLTDSLGATDSTDITVPPA